MAGLVDRYHVAGSSLIVVKRKISIFRYTLFFIITVLLAACSAGKGLAPVDERATKRHTGVSSTWYTVHKGDTLFSIAFAYGRDYRNVAKINRIRAPYTIYPGQRIRLVPKKSSTIASGTTKKSAPVTQSTAKKSARGTKKRSMARFIVSWKWPAKGSIIRKYSSSAPRKKGIGIAGKSGQAISAAASGKVVYSGNGLIGYGNLIIIKHNESFLSAYAHNKKVYVKEGQLVKRGEKIATMGKNENNRPMLHFEIRKNGKPVNPVSYLPKG